ncbi:MAG: 16S rRNA (uracil(1498)-N(3))-methyltransferase [Acidiphilium sp.]
MASIIRLHCGENLCSGALIAMDRARAHYLAHVMRRAEGDTLLLFNGRDGEFQAVIGRLERAAVTLTLGAQTRAPEAEPDGWLCFAPIKRDASEWVVEKATELGIAVIQPVITARTQPHRVNPERWAAIATEAAEQSERLSVPELRAPLPFATLLRDWPAGRILFAATERVAAPGLELPAERAQGWGLLIGPEGGFAPLELDDLAKHPFVTKISLGPRILRAETAAIAGLARLLAVPPESLTGV